MREEEEEEEEEEEGGGGGGEEEEEEEGEEEEEERGSIDSILPFSFFLSQHDWIDSAELFIPCHTKRHVERNTLCFAVCLLLRARVLLSAKQGRTDSPSILP